VERRQPRRLDIKSKVEHMFLGQYQHSIDDKGRLTIPARYRDILAAEGAFVTLGFDRNLMVLSVPVFEHISKLINQTSVTDPTARILRRQIYSYAELVSVDKVGRILVPQFLRESVDLDGEAMIVGAGSYFEIWSPALWSGQISQMQSGDSGALRFMGLNLSSGE
jgi:MraZ protein